MLQFANVYLPAVEPGIAASIAAKINPLDLFDFQSLKFPGRNRIGWTFPGMVRDRGIKLGSLFWPQGASRFAVSYLLADDYMVAKIRQNLAAVNYTPGLGYAPAYGPGKLVISEENQSFTTVGKVTATSMFMLPVRCLFDITGQNGMNLITLVDDRYFWWWRNSGNIQIQPSQTTWSDLFDLIVEALEVDIDYDPIAEAYQQPGAGLTSLYEQTPLLLDAVAYNVGQRIVVDLDGTVHSYTQPNSQAISEDNITGLLQYNNASLYIEGGGFIGGKDKPSLLPSAVTVTFPQSVSNVDMGTKYAITVPISSLASQELGQTGNGNVKTFHDTYAAEGPTQSPPNNLSQLQNLANQIALDWYLYQLGSIDAKFEGVVQWDIEALSDYVEWTHVKGEVSTRICRGAWNDLTEELLHGPAPVQPPCWVRILQSQSALQTIHLTGSSTRMISDANLGFISAVMESETANFTEADIGASVTSTYLNPGTTIIAIISATEALLSAHPTQDIENASVSITQTNFTIFGYKAYVDTQNIETGAWSDGTQVVWFVGGANEAPQPLRRYQCWLMGVDKDGLPVFSGVPGAVLTIINNNTPVGGYFDGSIYFYNGTSWGKGPNLWLIDPNS